ncbi:MAG: M23 family metallopeptidase [Chloroflexota bacterium]
MTIHNARLRALHMIVLVALCLAALGAQAAADDGTTQSPARAIPVARAIPRTFSSYESLIATASAVANDQVALYGQLEATRAEADLAKTIIASVTDPRLRGGLLRTLSDVADPAAPVAALRAALVATAATEAKLLASGAIATPPAITWKRPLAGEISQPFGPTYLGLEPARLYKGVFYGHFHDGVDILARGGTPIIAPARGRVVFAGRMGDGAEVVVIAHDNGLVSLYAHLENRLLAATLKTGDLVEAGDRIGAVGLTGLTTGYHLHWAVYRNGEPVDPLSTLGG